MIKAVLFDIDGVVIHSEQSFSHRIGVPLDATEPFFDTKFQECLVDKADLKIELGNHMMDWGWKGTVDELLKIWFEGEQEIDERVAQYIKKLRLEGYRVLACTNNERYRVEYLIDHLHLDTFFDKIYASCQVGFKKPETEFYYYILQKENLSKEEVVYWDNEKENVASARDWGIDSYLYITFEDFEKKMMDILQ